MTNDEFGASRPLSLRHAPRSAAQAATGFGHPLVAVPIFASAVDTRTAVVATTALGFCLPADTGYRERSSDRLRR